jgi:hypothetical protein
MPARKVDQNRIAENSPLPSTPNILAVTMEVIVVMTITKKLVALVRIIV